MHGRESKYNEKSKLLLYVQQFLIKFDVFVYFSDLGMYFQ